MGRFPDADPPLHYAQQLWTGPRRLWHGHFPIGEYKGRPPEAKILKFGNFPIEEYKGKPPEAENRNSIISL